ncbi:MAG: metal-dependent hydrolase [Vicinamibacterales bacterium]
MDNVCHTLMGAAIGKAGLARRTSLGMGTLMIASNLPDIDVGVFLTPTLAMSFRRGWTHGVLADVVLPPLLALAMLAWDRRIVQQGANAPPPARLGSLVLLSYAGVLMHVFMDYLNSYGVRLLMPFSAHWFYGDALFIVDLWLYLLLGGGVWLSLQRARRGSPNAHQPALAGLAVSIVYMLAMLGSNLVARDAVRNGLVRAGQPADTRFMVTPVLINPFKRDVVIVVGTRYEKGTLWFEPVPHFRPGGYGIDTGLDDPDVRAAMALPRAQAFMQWSRFPFAVVDRSKSPPMVWFNDYRYSNTGLGGWSATYASVGATDSGHR